MPVATRRLRHDPVEPLLARADSALAWAVGRDLLDQPLEPQVLWSLPFVENAVRHQLRDGSWRYGAGAPNPHEDYAQVATYKQLLVLVSIYRLDRRHPTLERAADFLLSHQEAVPRPRRDRLSRAATSCRWLAVTQRVRRRLRVNPTVCTGYGFCAEIVPELVSLDDWGYPIVSGADITTGKLLRHVRRAVSTCPRLALLVEESTAETNPV